MAKPITFDELSHFTDKQKLAQSLTEKYKYFLFGGASGPGKSYWLRWSPIKFLHKHCFKELGLKGVRAGLFCEDYPALWDRHISKIKYEFPQWLGTYNGQYHEFTLNPKYGSGVLAFRNLDDPSKYASSEFAWIGVDELTKNEKEKFNFLRWRLRWIGVNNTRFAAGTNPGGIGHEWVKKLWISRQFDSGERESDQFHFLPALPQDNPHLPDSYYTTLQSLPEALRKAYLEGNWDIFEGQYFSEWNSEVHTRPPFAIPESWPKYRAYDHGREAPACCKWYAVDPDGRVWVYREFYKAGMNVDQIAQEISKMSAGEQYQYSVADPSIFSNMGFVDKFGGQTIAETFSRYGIQFIPASNRRVDGWAIMHQYLHWDTHTLPKMMYFKTCYNSLRTIPALIHDDKHPEDLDTRGEDHAADPDRYFLMSLHERVPGDRPMNDIEKKLQRIKDQSYDLNKLYRGDYYHQNAYF